MFESTKCPLKQSVNPEDELNGTGSFDFISMPSQDISSLLPAVHFRFLAKLHVICSVVLLLCMTADNQSVKLAISYFLGFYAPQHHIVRHKQTTQDNKLMNIFLSRSNDVEVVSSGERSHGT